MAGASICGRAARERLEQQADPLDLGEAPDVDDDRAVGARRAVAQPPPPDGAAVHPVRTEDGGVEPVRERDEAVVRDAEQVRRPLVVAGRHEQLRAVRGPAAQAPLPSLGVRPRRAVGDRLEHEQLRAVQVADDRDARRGGRGRGVERREVVQVQDVGARGVDGA